MPQFRIVVAALLFASLTAFVAAQPPGATAPTRPSPAAPPAPDKGKAPAAAPPTTPPAPAAPAPGTPATPAPATPAPVPPTPPAAPATPAPAAPAADGKQAFTLKLEMGKPINEEMNTTVSQQIKVQGQDLMQKQEQSFTFEWTPEKQDGDKWTLKQKVTGVKMKIDISNNPIEYDSANKSPTGAAGNPGLTDFFKNLEGAEFTVTFNTKDNKVEKVEGKDEFVKRLSGGNSQLEGLLKKILTDEAVKQMTDPTYGLLPPAPKGLNETWEAKSSLNLGPIGSYDVTYKCTYKSKDKDVHTIEVVPTLTYKAPTEGTDGLLFRIKSGDLKSESPAPGLIKYNSTTGRIVEANIKIKLKGTLQVTIGGADTAVELNQEQATTIKMSDKGAATPEKK